MPISRLSGINPAALMLPAVLAAGIAGTAGPASAAGCDKCPERSVTLYDFEVDAPRPDSLAIPFAMQGTVTGQGFEVITGSGQVFDSATSVDDAFTDETCFSPPPR